MKIKAFTIWELLISIILLTSIASLVYFTFVKAGLLLNNDMERSDKLEQQTFMEKTLNDLFRLSDSIITETNYMIFYSENEEKYIEMFDCSFILWDQNEHEVFEWPIDSLRILYYNDDMDIVKGMLFTPCNEENNRILIEKTYDNRFKLAH